MHMEWNYAKQFLEFCKSIYFQQIDETLNEGSMDTSDQSKEHRNFWSSKKPYTAYHYSLSDFYNQLAGQTWALQLSLLAWLALVRDPKYQILFELDHWFVSYSLLELCFPLLANLNNVERYFVNYSKYIYYDYTHTGILQTKSIYIRTNSICVKCFYTCRILDIHFEKSG